jgi:hypothetical protein
VCSKLLEYCREAMTGMDRYARPAAGIVVFGFRVR